MDNVNSTQGDSVHSMVHKYILVAIGILALAFAGICVYLLSNVPATTAANTQISLDSYYPEKVTRGQFARILVKLFDLKMPGEITASFTDVPTNSIFFEDAEILKANNITKGCTETEFCPDRSMSYGELVTFAARALKVDLTKFDVPADAHFAQAPYLALESLKILPLECNKEDYITCLNQEISKSDTDKFILSTLEYLKK